MIKWLCRESEKQQRKQKKELSSATTTNINLPPFITATADGQKHLDMNLTKAKFDELTHDLVEKTAEPVQRALSDAGLQASSFKVLLVGGSTRIPAVQDKVRQLTGHEPSKSLNPDGEVRSTWCFRTGR